jgi:hypothetical protein
MESLVFACPLTRLTIDSGINTDADSLSAIRDLQVELHCPHCLSRHHFPVKSGRFAAEWARVA